jgi:outer membrane protein
MHSSPSVARAARAPATRLGALVLLALSVAPLRARGEPLSLAEAEKRALEASPAARVTRLDVAVAHQRTIQAYARHLGDLDLVAAANRFEGARLVKPITGPISPTAMAAMPFDRDQLHYGLAFQIPLFTGGTLLRSDQAARLSERAAADQAAHALEEVRYNVRIAYRGALGVRHALYAAIAYEQALAQDDASARLKVETEAWPFADAAKVSFALASARAHRALLAAQLRDAQQVLGALLGNEANAAYELEDLTAEPAFFEEPSIEDAVVGAQSARADLAAAREVAEAQAHRASAVRSGFWPQLALVGSYLLNDGRSLGRPLETYEITLQVKIPLLSGVGRAFAAQEADVVVAQLAEKQRGKALEVRRQVVEAFGRVEAARAALDAGKAQRGLGAEVARVEKLKLEAGNGKLEDYLTARAQELEGETGYWQGLYALQSAHDYLALVKGTGEMP